MNRDSDLEDLSREFADRFAALGRFFTELGSQESAQTMIDSLISGDAAAFGKLVDSVDIPSFAKVGKCFWLRQLIDHVVAAPYLVEVCTLRDDLSRVERALYFSIARRHGAAILLSLDQKAITVIAAGVEIPPGPFLDELKANGLVTCTTQVKYDVTYSAPLGKWERVCI